MPLCTVLVITPACRILVPLLIVGVGTEHMELPLPDNVSLFCLLSLPWSTNVEELPILVTLWREMEEFVQFLQEFWTSTCFFSSNNMWTFRGFVFLLKMLIWKKKRLCLYISLMILLRMLQKQQFHFGFVFFLLCVNVCMCYSFFKTFLLCVVVWMWNLD